jgi:hypothetical protein
MMVNDWEKAAKYLSRRAVEVYSREYYVDK